MLAIIIPYYKLSFFESALESLSNQTNKQFKVYIGDDASPENPKKLLEKYKNKLNFVYHRFDRNLGRISLVQQWERCIALSQDQEWLMILGDDDYLDDNVVEAFYKNFELFKDKANVVRFASRIDRHNLGIFSITYKHPVWEKASDSYFRKFQLLTMSSLSEYVFRRDSYHKYKFSNFPLAWYSDDMAWLEFSGDKPIFSINNAIVYFRFSDSNISGKEDNISEKRKARYLFLKKLTKELLSRFKSSQKTALLLEFGVVAKEQNKLNIKNSTYIAMKLLINGSFYALAKFIRRVFKAKFK